MSTTEPGPEMDALLGAYVLDALDPNERASVEAYLESNPRARAEVDDLRETAAVLAGSPGVDEEAPPELWERIAAQLEPAPLEPVRATGDEVGARRGARQSARAVWIASAAAAVAAAAAIVLAVQVTSLRDDLSDERDEPADVAAAFEQASEADGARTATLSSEQGDATVVVLPDGTGYVMNDNLSPLDETETYQLWAVVPGEAGARVISAGVLGPNPEAAAFKLDAPVAGFAMTVEEAGGVPTTDNDPIAAGDLT